MPSENALTFGVKRTCVLTKTYLRFGLNVLAFFDKKNGISRDDENFCKIDVLYHVCYFICLIIRSLFIIVFSAFLGDEYFCTLK